MNDAIAAWYVEQLLFALLVFTRLAVMLFAMPVMVSALPRHFKIFLPLAITMVILPSIYSTQSAGSGPFTMSVQSFVISLFNEGIVGLFIGAVVQLIVTGLQLGAELISSASGLQLGSGSIIGDTEPMPLIAAFVGVFVGAMMFASGSHRLIISALLDSYQGLPVGMAGLKSDVLEFLVNQLSQGFIAGIKLAGPVVTLVVLANILTGVISRTLPQINLFAIGLSLNMLVLLAGLALVLGSAGWLFQAELTRAAGSLSNVW